MRGLNNLTIVLLIAIWVLPAIPLRSQLPEKKQADLTIEWETGKRYEYNMELNNRSVTSVPGADQAQKSDTLQLLRFAVVPQPETEDGHRPMQFEYLSIRLHSKQNDVTFYFDSEQDPANDPDSEIIKHLRTVIGQPLTITLTQENKVESVSGAEPLLEKARASGEKPEAVLNNFIGKSSMVKLLEDNLLKGLPGRTVDIGEQWSENYILPVAVLGTLEVENVGRLEDIEPQAYRHIARISSKGRITTLKEDPNQNRDFKLAIEDGATSGQTWFDVTNGTVTKFKQLNKMNLLLTPNNPSGDNATQIQIRNLQESNGALIEAEKQ